jgi:hypothetical protein
MSAIATTLSAVDADVLGMILSHIDVSGLVQLQGTGDRNLLMRMKQVSTCRALRFVTTNARSSLVKLDRVPYFSQVQHFSFVVLDLEAQSILASCKIFSKLLTLKPGSLRSLNLIGGDIWAQAEALWSNQPHFHGLETLSISTHIFRAVPLPRSLTSLSITTCIPFALNLIAFQGLAQLQKLSLPTCSRISYDPLDTANTLKHLTYFHVWPTVIFEPTNGLGRKPKSAASDEPIDDFLKFFRFLPATLEYFNHVKVHLAREEVPWWKNLRSYRVETEDVSSPSHLSFPPRLTSFKLFGAPPSDGSYPWDRLFSALPKSITKLQIDNPPKVDFLVHLRQFPHLTELRTAVTKQESFEALPPSLTCLLNTKWNEQTSPEQIEGDVVESRPLVESHLPEKVQYHVNLSLLQPSQFEITIRIPRLLRQHEDLRALGDFEWINTKQAISLDLPCVLEYMVDIYSPVLDLLSAPQTLRLVLEKGAIKVARWLINLSKFGFLLSNPTKDSLQPRTSSINTNTNTTFNAKPTHQDHFAILDDRWSASPLEFKSTLCELVLRFFPPEKNFIHLWKSPETDCLPYLLAYFQCDFSALQSPNLASLVMNSLIAGKQWNSLRFISHQLNLHIKGEPPNWLRTQLSCLFFGRKGSLPNPIQVEIPELIMNQNLDTLELALKLFSPCSKSAGTDADADTDANDSLQEKVVPLEWRIEMEDSGNFANKLAARQSSTELVRVIRHFRKITEVFPSLGCSSRVWVDLMSIICTPDLISVELIDEFALLNVPFHQVRYFMGDRNLAHLFAETTSPQVLARLLLTPGILLTFPNVWGKNAAINAIMALSSCNEDDPDDSYDSYDSDDSNDEVIMREPLDHEPNGNVSPSQEGLSPPGEEEVVRAMIKASVHQDPSFSEYFLKVHALYIPSIANSFHSRKLLHAMIKARVRQEVSFRKYFQKNNGKIRSPHSLITRSMMMFQPVATGEHALLQSIVSQEIYSIFPSFEHLRWKNYADPESYLPSYPRPIANQRGLNAEKSEEEGGGKQIASFLDDADLSSKASDISISGIKLDRSIPKEENPRTFKWGPFVDHSRKNGGSAFASVDSVSTARSSKEGEKAAPSKTGFPVNTGRTFGSSKVAFSSSSSSSSSPLTSSVSSPRTTSSFGPNPTPSFGSKPTSPTTSFGASRPPSSAFSTPFKKSFGAKPSTGAQPASSSFGKKKTLSPSPSSSFGASSTKFGASANPEANLSAATTGDSSTSISGSAKRSSEFAPSNSFSETTTNASSPQISFGSARKNSTFGAKPPPPDLQ